MKRTNSKRMLGFFTQLPRRRYIEAVAAVFAVVVVGILAAFISPYSPQREASFFESDRAEQSSVYRATVETVNEDTVTVRLGDGPTKGSVVAVPYTQLEADTSQLRPGNAILLSSSVSSDTLYVLDRFRIPALLILAALFGVIVLLVGRRKGLRSLVGLTASILVVLFFLVPMVINGANAFAVSIVSALLIAGLTTVVSQGFTRKAVVLFGCMAAILLLVACAAGFAVYFIGLTGRLDEVSYYLSSANAAINLGDLVSGGIIIAALGALDDIVTTQVATVEELRKSADKASNRVVFARASRVGAEHIASLVNTLALVYVGAALPVIVGSAMSSESALLLFNSEFAATEITRTLIISAGLVLAVPLSTLLAVRYITARS
jgi:uncharacterized membrane protein